MEAELSGHLFLIVFYASIHHRMPESPNKQLVAASSVAKNSGNQAGGYSQQANFRDIIINSREVRLGREYLIKHDGSQTLICSA